MQSHDVLNPPHKADEALVDPLSCVVLGCANHPQPAQAKKHPNDGRQGQKQEQKDADKGSNGAHGSRVVPKVRTGTASVGTEQREPRGSGHAVGVKVAGNGALHLFCGRSDNVDFLVRDGMLESQLRAGQMQSMTCVAGQRSIHLIPDDGMPNRGGMPSDLVRSASTQLPFHKRGVPVHGPRTVTEDLEICATRFAFNCQRNQASRGCELAFHPAVVGFLDIWPNRLNALKHICRFRNHHGASCAVVQPVDGLEPLGMFVMRRPYQVHQRFPFAMDSQTCGLQHHQQMGIFVEVEGKRFHDHVLRQKCIQRTKFPVLGQKSTIKSSKVEIYTTKHYLISTEETPRMRIERMTWWVVLLCMIMWCEVTAQAHLKENAAFAGQKVCHTMGNLDRLLQNHPDLRLNVDKVQSQVQSFVAKRKASGAVGMPSTVVVPVVFHVVHNTLSENISEAQILSQLDILNQDFRRLNEDQDNIWPQAADTHIEFCLAARDPEGNPTDGIVRVATDVTVFGPNDAMKFASQGGSDAWPASDYLNIWICDLGPGLLGYAQFPGMGLAESDGVVCNYLAVGNVGTATFPFHLGRRATHEIGHYLGLYHTWGDGGCEVDDFVLDTPNADGPNYGCELGSSSCVEGTDAMVQNYMDYSDDACMNLFTEGQATRMLAQFAPGGARFSLLSSLGCTPPGTEYERDAEVLVFLSPYLSVCSQSLAPVVRIRNAGNQPLTSLALELSVGDVPVDTATWNGSIEFLDVLDLTFAEVDLESGAYDVSVAILNVNGAADDNPNNDVLETSFVANATDNSVTLNVGGGSWDGDIGWSLELDGVAIAQGGAGSFDLCIPEGCFIFHMSDPFFDGWNGATYSFVGSDGQVLASGDLDNAALGDGLSTGADFLSLGPNDCQWGCTDPSACNHDLDATADDGTCAYPEEGLTCPSCDLEVQFLMEDLEGGEAGEAIQIDAFGSLEAMEISLAWTNVEQDASWAADLMIEVGLPNGDCVALGGYNVTSDCNSLGNFSAIWPSSWQSSNSGVFEAILAADVWGLAGEGEWTFSVVNGYGSSDGIELDMTLKLVGLCAPGEAVQNGCTDAAASNFDPTANVDDGSCLPASDCQADLNGDGQVTVSDVLVLLADFGCATSCNADLSGDDITSVEDILLMLAAFGEPC